MTIYNQIKKNKWRTIFIFVLFTLLVSGFFYLIGLIYDSPTSYFIVGFLLAVGSGFFSYFYSDKIILFTHNAKPANKKDHFNFYTVAENLSLAAGLPMPKLYVIEDPAPNAFATGRNYKQAVVCATTGLLNLLDRTELEGVVAHELSHIKNYDILLASVVATLVGTISIVSDWILRNMWWSRRDDNQIDRNPLMLIFVVIALIIGPLVATLIQLAISRQREFLADASGALITRYPEGLARALEKISHSSFVLQTASSGTAHLFVVNPFKLKNVSSLLVNLFNTHPPVEERIRILRSM